MYARTILRFFASYNQAVLNAPAVHGKHKSHFTAPIHLLTAAVRGWSRRLIPFPPPATTARPTSPPQSLLGHSSPPLSSPAAQQQMGSIHLPPSRAQQAQQVGVALLSFTLNFICRVIWCPTFSLKLSWQERSDTFSYLYQLQYMLCNVSFYPRII